MTCGTLQTGNHFLGGVLTQVDCQAQAIGAYGFGALADPNSPTASFLLALLTLFIALFGVRLMYGERPAGRDLVGELIKIGIVLTLATSWPAWRTLAYQTVLDAPSQVAGTIGRGAGLPGSNADMVERLDNLDQAIISLTAFGSGRLTGGIVGSSDLGDSTRGIALADQSGLAWGRVTFLTGTIGPIALIRLSAGILLALAPLMAGLLLFAGTRDVFMGWLRALGACAIGSLALTLVHGVELAVFESWLRDALTQRAANVLTPAAPTELLVLALAFAVIAFGLMGLVMRMLFFAMPGWQRMTLAFEEAMSALRQPARTLAIARPPSVLEPARAEQIADAVARTVRREEAAETAVRSQRWSLGSGRREQSTANEGNNQAAQALGNSYRRNHRRHSAGAERRDATS